VFLCLSVKGQSIWILEIIRLSIKQVLTSGFCSVKLFEVCVFLLSPGWHTSLLLGYPEQLIVAVA